MSVNIPFLHRQAIFISLSDKPECGRIDIMLLQKILESVSVLGVNRIIEGRRFLVSFSEYLDNLRHVS